MSYTINGYVRSTANLTRIIEIVEQRKQVAIAAAEAAGLEYLRNETPVDTGALVSTAEAHENQYAVWFSLAVNPAGSQMGGEHDYGFYQEFGWHDRGGHWHPGNFMVRGAAEVAYEAFVLAMGGPGGGTLFRPQAAFRAPVVFGTPGAF